MTGTNSNLNRPGIALRLPNRMASLEQARLAVIDYLRGFDVGAGPINRIEVVLEELVSNVARHAKRATSITVEANIGDQGVILSVADDGEAFNPLDKPDPAPFTTLENAQLGGQGIPLIKRLTQQVRYDRKGQSNCVTAVFPLD